MSDKKYRLIFPDMIHKNLAWLVAMYEKEEQDGTIRDNWPTSIPGTWLHAEEERTDASNYINGIIESKGIEKANAKDLFFNWIDMSQCWDYSVERYKSELREKIVDNLKSSKSGHSYDCGLKFVLDILEKD